MKRIIKYNTNMECLQPTIINVYQIPGEEKKIVRRIFNIPNRQLQEELKTEGNWYIIHLNEKEAEERHKKKGQSEWARCTFSRRIDCGKCINCAAKTSKHLANRILLETQDKEAYFLTFTYNEENNPGSLKKEHAEEIIKAMKKDAPAIRYLICGEYGSKTGRPHYHAIIWNTEGLKLNIGEIREQGKDHINKLFTSKYWTKGDSTIAKADPQTIYYTAAYCEKKIYRPDEEKEKIKNLGLIPEFRNMSRAIAYNYYKEHEEEIDKNKGKIIIKGGIEITTDRSYIKFKEKEGKEKPQYMENYIQTIEKEKYKPLKSKKEKQRQ